MPFSDCISRLICIYIYRVYLAFFLVSTDARNSPSVCGDLPLWSTVMRTTVLYYFICNAIYIQNVCISGIILFITFVGMSKTFYTVIL